MRARQRAEYDWWYRASYPGVVRTTFLILHDQGRAEEVTQDAFVAMLRNWGTVGAYENPGAWVRRVAIRDAVRTARREQVRPVKEQLSAIHGVAAIPHPEVAAAVATLSPMQRAAVVLYYWVDQPVQEVARTLDVSESTVKQHLLRARSKLADLLAEEVSEGVD